MSQEPTVYNVSRLVKFFHSFPHYDITFDPVSSAFAPEDEQYQEVGLAGFFPHLTRFDKVIFFVEVYLSLLQKFINGRILYIFIKNCL